VARIAAEGRALGLATTIFDPATARKPDPELRGIPRPNVRIDLPGTGPERVLLLAHYDVVPVPAEQRARWATPPDRLTLRSDGRLYGRGANDDLGSGVVASLLALRRLAQGPPPARSVRLLVCCDEETGGVGGVEALKHHDATLPAHDAERWLEGDVALIPDGSPHVCAASSGVVFLDAVVDRPSPLAPIVELGAAFESLHATVRAWRSRYRSPDWPDHGAPEPVLTGRLTVTRFDATAVEPLPPDLTLAALHAETDAANQIAESVTLVFQGKGIDRTALADRLGPLVAPPFRLDDHPTTALRVPAGSIAVAIVGKSAHGGYPHVGLNPVSATFGVLRAALAAGWISADVRYTATFALDLRLPPEMALAEGRDPVLAAGRAAIARLGIAARLDAPPGRSRRGYALAPDHPVAVRLDRILAATFGAAGVFGEYGGTDASTLAELVTPAGEPLPAIVFGSMDRSANIHQAEESADPRAIGGVARAIERFVREP